MRLRKRDPVKNQKAFQVFLDTLLRVETSHIGCVNQPTSDQEIGYKEVLFRLPHPLVDIPIPSSCHFYRKGSCPWPALLARKAEILF